MKAGEASSKQLVGQQWRDECCLAPSSPFPACGKQPAVSLIPTSVCPGSDEAHSSQRNPAGNCISKRELRVKELLWFSRVTMCIGVQKEVRSLGSQGLASIQK